MVLDQPATATELAAGLNLTVDVVEQLLAELQREYSGYTVKAPDMDDASDAGFSSSPRGFELRNIAGGWRIYSRADFADIVGRFVLEGQTARLTQAALETLAVIAYRQPVSRARVSAIRGVNVDSVVRTLTQRGLIEDVGKRSGVGRHPVPDYIVFPGTDGNRLRGGAASALTPSSGAGGHRGVLRRRQNVGGASRLRTRVFIRADNILHGWLGLFLDNLPVNISKDGS